MDAADNISTIDNLIELQKIRQNNLQEETAEHTWLPNALSLVEPPFLLLLLPFSPNFSRSSAYSIVTGKRRTPTERHSMFP